MTKKKTSNQWEKLFMKDIGEQGNDLKHCKVWSQMH